MTTPLMLAVKANKPDAIRLLLDNGANIDQQHVILDDIEQHNYTERTALHYAARKGPSSLMTLLLDNGADPNIKDKYGMTPLVLIMTRSKPDMDKMTMLIRYGTDLTTLDHNGRTCMHIAVSRHSVSMVQLLLDLSDDPIKLLNIEDYSGYKPLLLAIHNKANTSMIDVLCRPGTEGGVLHGLAYTNDFKQTKYLISKGHDPNEKNSSGLTPIHVAIISENYEMMQLLIDNGADVHLTMINKDGLTRTALELAKEQGVLICGH